MKKHMTHLGISLIAVLALVFVTPSAPAPLQAAGCAKIKDGTIIASNGDPLKLGYDEFGYNYQARLFNGTYDSSDRNLDGKYWGNDGDYVDDSLVMKWSEDWLSNMDCNNDGKLDRGDAGISMGWTTNHIEGDYLDGDGDSHHYTYEVKIVYDGGEACAAGEGTCLWGMYRIIHEVYNDPDGGYHGVDHSRLGNPAGLGFYK